MPHHLAQGRPGQARESLPASVAREVVVWNIIGLPEDHPFPSQLEPGDMAIRPNGEVYLWNGIEWFLLASSKKTLDKSRVKLLQVKGGTLEVSYDDEE